ncbi:DUF6233 domain-containing protein [Streptomyces sp. NPDC090442]|uniref:DUF6233 domain-containing protein n=1 Tax=Streptomyces sp. NPDC090442 TaxID=3365962 RepID=UPI00382BC368
MNDLPPDLPRLRTLETWLHMTLARVRGRIAEVERQQTVAAQTAPPPRRAQWLLQTDVGASSRPVALHVGNCSAAGRRARPLTREQALHAIAEGLEACVLCRPDTELGLV